MEAPYLVPTGSPIAQQKGKAPRASPGTGRADKLQHRERPENWGLNHRRSLIFPLRGANMLRSRSKSGGYNGPADPGASRRGPSSDGGGAPPGRGPGGVGKKAGPEAVLVGVPELGRKLHKYS